VYEVAVAQAQPKPKALGGEAQVRSWRLEQLLALGCSYALAVELAQSEADLHVMLDALARGCSPALLKRIIL
jgi:hypothetical protein